MKGPIHARRWNELPSRRRRTPALCECGHAHLVSLGDDGADAGCVKVGRGCECWTFREAGQ